MMTMSGVAVVVMVVMMIVMCGGMIAGAVWAVFRRNRRPS